MKLVQVQLVKRIADINGIRWINGNNKIVRDEMQELKKYRNWILKNKYCLLKIKK